MINVLVADQHRLLAQALAAALQAPDLTVVDCYPTTGVAAVRAVADLRPNVAVIDYGLLGMTGPVAARIIRPRALTTGIVLLSSMPGSKEVREAVATGAAALIPKWFGIDQLANAVRGAASTIPYTGDAAFREHDPVWARIASLTIRELEVLTLMATESAESIADELVLTVGTVRNYIQRVLRKTGTRTQLEAVDVARRHGVV